MEMVVEWMYQLALRREQRRVLPLEVLGTWSNADQSTRQRVIDVLDLSSKVAARPAAEHAIYRGQAQEICRQMLSRLEPNDRGRVLGILHQLLDQIHPGSMACFKLGVRGLSPSGLPPVFSEAKWRSTTHRCIAAVVGHARHRHERRQNADATGGKGSITATR
jgi:hypothetical protein